MAYMRDVIVGIMQSWVGKRESDGSYKEIINIYNAISPLPRGYRLRYSDPWCAGCVSAAFAKAGYLGIFPAECSCYAMIELAKKMGIWMETDSYIPKPGDIVMYDWQDSGVGDNRGMPDHVGVVEVVEDNRITIIEGNMDNAVGRRTISINGRYIRGFIIPKYTDKTTAKPVQIPKTVEMPKTPTTVKASQYAKSGPNNSLTGAYITTAELHIRDGAGTKYKSLAILPKNHTVQNYGFYTTVGNVKWLYVQTVFNGITYTGFCSSAYLKKK